MIFCGLDFGEKTIGVSISDCLEVTANPCCILRRDNPLALKGSIAELKKLVVERNIESFVLGMPRNLNNTDGDRTEITQKFADRLKKDIKIPIVFWDERMTTVAAERMMLEADLSRKKRKSVVDAVAATIILQNYLDFKRNEKTGANKNPKDESSISKRLKVKWRMKNLDNEYSGINNEEETEEFDVIVLTDDETNEDVELVIIDSEEMNGCTYLLVIASEDFDEEEPTASIIKEMKMENDEIVYEIVEDEEEFEKASELFKDNEDFEIN